MRMRTIATRFVLTAFLAVGALAADTVYVDLSGIDTAFPDLTAEQRQELKDLIIADMQANFDVAGVDITVTTDATADADRTVHINDDLGTHENADGSTGHHYGEWEHGSDEVNVHLDNFTDRHGDDYKTDGEWDLDKLRKGIGRTAAHEVAHSYSVGHNEHEPPDKMTEGGLVSSETRATTEWIFDDHASEVMNENLGKEPCDATEDYDEDYIETVFYETPEFPFDPEEYPGFDAGLDIFGPLAAMFDFGWYGVDSDGGLIDGDPDFDFIYKASAAEPSGPPPMLTFLPGHHDTIQFLIRGREGSPWPGQWWRMTEAQIFLGDPVITPAGDEVFRQLGLSWDIDGDLSPDVQVGLDTLTAYTGYVAQFNGFRLGHVWPCPGDLNHDGSINLLDLATLLAHYGQTHGSRFEEGDLDGDGDVTLNDLAALLAVYGTTCTEPPLWSENFDSYPPGSGLHGQGGWHGWDDDSTFDAFVSLTQSLSEPQSAEVAGNSDIVHEFSGASSGVWSFSTWQYIPADFFSPGSDPFVGSYFVLLNTYNDGGPYNWSVQMQFDSTDGMLKVYHGDGTNTINVPYDTERWVKIEAIVDLDSDWTQVYYDDNLISEYSWTGGVLGDGGGALDIAAVDLFANGSTSIFYDDGLLH